MIPDGYVRVRDSLYTQVTICINNILNHIDIGYERTCMVSKTQIPSKTHTPSRDQKNAKSLLDCEASKE